MPWTQSVAEVMNVLVNAKLLTDKEYTDVRSLLSKTHSMVATSELLNVRAAVLGDDDSQVKVNTASVGATRELQLYKFGTGSLNEQKGVHPILLAVANRAIQITTQDMVFYDGVRTLKEQTANVKKGVSKTMNSKHLPQKDGYSHAMDLVPYINGKPTWDWEGCYRIALAVDQAATEQEVAHLITWGGAWDRRLSDFGGDVTAYKREVEAYAARHPGKDFLDGPHFELTGV